MVALWSFLVLLAVHVLPWLLQPKVTIANSPAKLAILLSAVQFLPQFFILIFLPERSLLAGATSYSIAELLTYFGLLYSVCLLLFLHGVRVGRSAVGAIVPASQRVYQFKNTGAIISILLLVYVGCIYQIFASAGGLAFFLENIGARASLLAGTGIYFIFTSPASYMIIFLAIFSHHHSGRPNFLVVLMLILFVTGVESLLGGRRQPVQLLLFAAFAFSLLSKRKSFFTLRNALLSALALGLFSVLLAVRVGSDDGIDFLEIILNLSHIDVYLFIMDHFRDRGYWFGQSFLDLVVRFIPGAVSSAPPIDEGVYVYNLFLGYAVLPPTPMENMAWNSWPPGTFGTGYMNFGPVGAVLFFFIRGLVVGGAFQVCRKLNYPPSLLLIYLWVAFGFQISNLKITQFLMLIVGLAALLPVISLIKRTSFGSRSPAMRR